jgi:hypothetical protein
MPASISGTQYQEEDMLRLAVRVLAVAVTLALQAVGGRAQDVTLKFSHYLGTDQLLPGRRGGTLG